MVTHSQSKIILRATNFKTAILSYEGSAGRTLIARNLFHYVSSNMDGPVQLAGFDIEKPDLMNWCDGFRLQTEEVFAQVPRVEISRCKFCGVCAVFCRGQAISFDRYKPSVSIIAERCTACGDCLAACNRQAIHSSQRLTGYITQGRNGKQFLLIGQPDGNEAFHVPLLSNMIERLHPEAMIIADFAPGNTNQVRVSLQTFGQAAIVLKPSLGWEHNLGAMCQMTEDCKVPSGVILNKIRHESGFIAEVSDYCLQHEIALFGTLPFNEDLEKGFLYTHSVAHQKLGKALAEIALNMQFPGGSRE